MKNEFEQITNMIGSLVNIVKRQSDEIEELQQRLCYTEMQIRNARYEILDPREVTVYPNIKSAEETIDLILREKKSLCRFGDGEMEMILRRERQPFQRFNELLAIRLEEVLKSKRSDVLIGLADNYGNLEKYNEQGRYGISMYMSNKTRKEHYSLLDMERTYYDGYITRPYVIYSDNMTDAPQGRFRHLRCIWEDRDVLIVEGEKTRMGVGNDLFDDAKSIKRILGPAENAFDKYDEILETV